MTDKAGEQEDTSQSQGRWGALLPETPGMVDAWRLEGS